MGTECPPAFGAAAIGLLRLVRLLRRMDTMPMPASCAGVALIQATNPCQSARRMNLVCRLITSRGASPATPPAHQPSTAARPGCPCGPVSASTAGGRPAEVRSTKRAACFAECRRVRGLGAGEVRGVWRSLTLWVSWRTQKPTTAQGRAYSTVCSLRVTAIMRAVRTGCA